MHENVFPMHVGVFLRHMQCPFSSLGLPHARGGVSELVQSSTSTAMSSPCTWGCFLRLSRVEEYPAVFPMHVGVFLKAGVLHYTCDSLPHARGGVSI